MSLIFGRLHALFIAIGLAFAVCPPAQAVELQTITIKVGYGAGGGFDQTSRLIARHLGRFLPGNPSIVVQNVPGGGSLKLTKMLMGSEPADGSVIASISEAMFYAPILDPENATFDPLALQWLGSLVNDPAYCLTSKQSGIDTMEKFLQSDFLIGATGKNSTTYIFAALAKNGMKARYKIVTGFEGTADIELAMQRGEIAGMCGVSSALLRADRAAINIIGMFGQRGSVPRLTDGIVDPTARQAADLIESALHIHHPLVAPPGVSKETLGVLRKAYSDMVVDPDFLTDAAKLGDLTLNPTSGEAISQLVAQQLKATPAVFAAARELVK